METKVQVTVENAEEKIPVRTPDEGRDISRLSDDLCIMISYGDDGKPVYRCNLGGTGEFSGPSEGTILQNPKSATRALTKSKAA